MQTITGSKKPRNWTRRRINAELKGRRMCQADIVRSTGKSQPMVSEVVAGRRKSQPIADAIAGAIGRFPWEIWPRLYAPPSEEPKTAPTGAPDAIATAC